MLTMLKNMKIILGGIDLDSLAKKAAFQILVDGCPCKILSDDSPSMIHYVESKNLMIMNSLIY